MTQTKAFVRYLIGLNFAMEPNVMINPSGNATSKVYKNIWQFCAKPSNKLNVTSLNQAAPYYLLG